MSDTGTWDYQTDTWTWTDVAEGDVGRDAQDAARMVEIYNAILKQLTQGATDPVAFAGTRMAAALLTLSVVINQHA